MTYSVKELFLTIQGEGAQTGRAAVFCRFSGCNLWTGREEDRSSAICQFCDTDFVGTDGLGGGKFATAADLAQAVAGFWPGKAGRPFVVLTGGEPLLQVDAALIDALHAQGFEIAVETNGTLPAPAGLDWICVSPKAGSTLVQQTGHELKVVMPQAGFDEASLLAFEQMGFEQLRIQPLDSAAPEARVQAAQWAVQWCLDHPRWMLSVQTHKTLGIR